MGCKKQGAKNRVVVIQKEKRQPSLFLINNDPDFCTLLFEPHILTQFFSGPATDPVF
jgi:hypothetical protein